jgi:diadenosine tetraphosphate (Ap4A) HIT family hydrolase
MKQLDKPREAAAAPQGCFGCAIQGGSFKVSGGFIHECQGFNAVQDPLVPIPGFMVINAKRHISSIGQFTRAERIEFTEFVHAVRTAMREALGIQTVYLVQEEDACHFHLWLFPRHPWMKRFKPGIAPLRRIMAYAKKNMTTDEDAKNVARATAALRRHFQQRRGR